MTPSASGPALNPRWTPFLGLEIGPLLGNGVRSRVYRGHRHGSPFAVKVVFWSLLSLDANPLPKRPFFVLLPDQVSSYL